MFKSSWSTMSAITPDSVKQWAKTVDIVIIYTDGSYRENIGIGWAYIITSEDEEVIHSQSGCINNKEAFKSRQIAGECAAVMNALCWCKENKVKAIIYHDYIGVEKWATGEWKANKYVSQKYKDFIYNHKQQIKKFIHVKAHSGNRLNDLVDSLAKKACN